VPDRVDWRPVVAGADCVFHVAGSAQSGANLAQDVHAATRMGEAAMAAGVRRIVLLSTIKVHGETTPPGQAFSEHSALNPFDDYARARLAVEAALTPICGERLVVVRAPLVYGPGARGNFRRLAGLVASGMPLPFAGLDNRRAMVSLTTLVAFLRHVATHPAAGGRAWAISDNEDISTPELMRRIGGAMGMEARLFALPEPLLRAMLWPFGAGALTRRLLDDLAVDMSAAIHDLGFRPPETLGQGVWRAFNRGGAVALLPEEPDTA
jgi:nucleoside-diphosphate-sugar epimerase